jgi:hypothetical protein
VEERAGERRFVRRAPLSLSLSPLGGARGRNPTISKEFAKRCNALPKYFFSKKSVLICVNLWLSFQLGMQTQASA